MAVRRPAETDRVPCDLCASGSLAPFCLMFNVGKGMCRIDLCESHRANLRASVATVLRWYFTCQPPRHVQIMFCGDSDLDEANLHLHALLAELEAGG